MQKDNILSFWVVPTSAEVYQAGCRFARVDRVQQYALEPRKQLDGRYRILSRKAITWPHVIGVN